MLTDIEKRDRKEAGPLAKGAAGGDGSGGGVKRSTFLVDHPTSTTTTPKATLSSIFSYKKSRAAPSSSSSSSAAVAAVAITALAEGTAGSLVKGQLRRSVKKRQQASRAPSSSPQSQPNDSLSKSFSSRKTDVSSTDSSIKDLCVEITSDNMTNPDAAVSSTSSIGQQTSSKSNSIIIKSSKDNQTSIVREIVKINQFSQEFKKRIEYAKFKVSLGWERYSFDQVQQLFVELTPDQILQQRDTIIRKYPGLSEFPSQEEAELLVLEDRELLISGDGRIANCTTSHRNSSSTTTSIPPTNTSAINCDNPTHTSISTSNINSSLSPSSTTIQPSITQGLSRSINSTDLPSLNEFSLASAEQPSHLDTPSHIFTFQNFSPSYIHNSDTFSINTNETAAATMAAAASTTNFNFGNDSISSFTNTLQKQQSNLIWKYLDTSNLLDGSDLSNFHYGGANGGGSKILGPYLNNQRLFQQTPHDIHMTNYNAFSQQQQQHDHLQHYHHPSIRRHNSVGNLNLPISNYTNNPSSSQLQISDITNTASGNMGGMIGALDLSRPYVQEAGENFMSAEQYLGIVEMEWQSIL